MLRLLFLVLLLPIAHAWARPLLNVEKSSGEGILLEVNFPASYDIAQTTPRGMARIDSAQLPFLSRLFGAPPGAQINVRVRQAEYEEFERVEWDGNSPTDLVSSRPLGLLRGVEAHALVVSPYQYDERRNALRVYTRLRIEIRFTGGRQAKRTLPTAPSAAPYRAFLNAVQAPYFARERPSPKGTAARWYDAERPWVKVIVDADGIHQIDYSWLERFSSVDAIDPQTLQLFHAGQEQPVYVAGEADKRFDESDFLLFYGQFRRGTGQHENLYGKDNTYWLTWGGSRGLRYAEKSAAPNSSYPQTDSFWHVAHFQRDLIFDALVSAPDAERDHWFWTLNNKPLTATKADVPSSAEFPGDLPHPDLDRAYDAHIRVALHGASDLGHHTVLKLNAREVLVDTVWGTSGNGMIDFLGEFSVDRSHLKDGRNRILLQVFADQAKFDLMWFNWFEIGYFRRYVSHLGYLEAAHPASEGHQISAQKFTHPHVEIFELNSGARLIDAAISEDGDLYTATFADRAERDARYVMADSTTFLTPKGRLDAHSDWRTFSGADLLVLAHPRHMNAAERLAEHRRTAGLSAVAISSQDIYDEFNHGLMDAEAIAAFIEHAYANWPLQPRYVVLLGDDTWDYRNIIGGGRPNVVPSLYYQSRGRGLAPSDFLYALVDGDDLLPDLSIGRLPASSAREAEAIVDKIISYDTPAPGPWRTRALFVANYHPKDLFSEPSDSLIARYVKPTGLQPIRVYNADEQAIPNPTGRAFTQALNEGALLINFNGHGSPGTMQSLFTLSLPDWGYMGQVQNGQRLPLVLALSCLNGLFANPVVEGIAEAFVRNRDGGAIAYISASAKSFVAQNDLLSDRFYDALFASEPTSFGPALDVAKAQVLAAHPSWIDAALTMQLLGDPTQELALPAAPDYAAQLLAVDADPVQGHSTVEIHTTLANYGRLGADSVRVELLAYPDDEALPDTLQSFLTPPFSGERTLSFSWPTGARRGTWRLVLTLDGDKRLPELDEGNNVLEQQVDIRAPLVAEPIYPADNAALSADSLRLEAIVPHDADALFCEFEFASTPDFGDAMRSPLVAVENGLAVYGPVWEDDATYFWRVRLYADATPGIWSSTRSLHTANGPVWSQRTVQLLHSAGTRFELRDDALRLSSTPLPLRPDSTTREDGFTVRDHAGSGIVVTDGTWLYAKRWYNDDSTIYPGTDYFTRIGTGLNDTFRSGNFGAVGDSTTAGISATYHSDGYIYNESGKAYELERLSLQTGTLDTVSVPDGLLEWKFGRVEDGHSLITSDGTYVYNVSMSTPKGARNAWNVRVFDPAQSWDLVREFTSPPTENGFTFEWTDGILADGRYLYFIEWQGQQRIRMVDAQDGTFVDEWQSDQDVTRIITGQYDWVNNKVWLGDLLSSAVFRYTGAERIGEGSFVSQPIGPVARWNALQFAGNNVRVDVEIPAEGQQWQAPEELRGLSPERIDLSTLDATVYPQVRLRAYFDSPEAALTDWSIDFVPRPSLEIVRAEGRDQAGSLSVEISVRNRSDRTVNDAVLYLEQSDLSMPLRQTALPSIERGQTLTVAVDSLTLPSRNTHLFAEVLSGQPDANPEDNRLPVVLLVEGRLPVEIALWPEGSPFISGDPLRSGQGLLVSAADLPNADIEVRIDGQVVTPDSLIDAYPAPPRLLFRPSLAPGAHHIEAQLVRDNQPLGTTDLSFYVDDALRIRNALLFPHPVTQETHFTYVLSHPALIEIEIFSLSGKHIRRLGPFEQQAGFGQTGWDGRDGGGRRLANGTYLYRIVAENAERNEAVFRGTLLIAR